MSANMAAESEILIVVGEAEEFDVLSPYTPLSVHRARPKRSKRDAPRGCTHSERRSGFHCLLDPRGRHTDAP